MKAVPFVPKDHVPPILGRLKCDELTMQLVPEVRSVACLVMDCSTSMRDFGKAPRRVMNEYVRTLRESVSAKTTSVCVLRFAAELEVVAQNQIAVAAGDVPRFELTRGTRLFGALLTVLEKVVGAVEAERARGRPVNATVTLFTDGYDWLSTQEERQALPDMVMQAKMNDVKVLLVGIGVELYGFADEIWVAPSDVIFIKPTCDELIQSGRAISEITRERSESAR
ncbi:MAG: vWA domain-containing protein [bacterium]